MTLDAARGADEGPKTAGSEAAPASREMRVEAYFPTLIGFQDWPDAEALNASLKRHIYAWRASDPQGIERSNVRSMGAWHSATDMQLRPELADFVARVTRAVDAYFEQIGCDPGWPATCDAMWANISPRYAYNKNHAHGSALCSGVYYVQADSPRSGSVNFYDPRVQAITTPVYTEAARKRRPHTWPKVYFKPTEGRIVLFPGWLNHDVDANLSESEGPPGDRISISFNYHQRRPAPGAPER